MPWAQRVTASVNTICRPTNICSAALRPPRSLFVSTYAQHASISPTLTRLFRSGAPFLQHSFGAQRTLRQATSEMAEHIANSECMTSCVSETTSSGDSSNSGEAPASAAYRVVNFYHLIDIPNPYQVIAEHKLWVKDKDLAGRIYLSTQGINAQYSGLTAHAEGYANWLQEQDLFKGLRWSSFPVDSHQFPKLRLKFKQNLISLAGGMTRLPVTDPKARATPLAPSQWKQMLADAQQLSPRLQQADIADRQEDARSRPDSSAESSGSSDDSGATAVAARPDVVVLDVRNDYEWDAGHFQGAKRPQEENFNETPTEISSSESIPSYLQGKDLATPVMMYCTGGIRCDVYSAHLRDKGFNNLYTLEGGIQNYLREEGHEMWRGSLFVFDGRMAVPSGDPGHEGQLVAAAPCAACGQAASLPHMNCANIDCNKLFLACNKHKEEFAGCCSQACMEAPRLLRPPKQAGYYGNWTTYSSDDELGRVSMTEGRSSGRLARRQKRLERVRAKEAIAREERHTRKQLAKAAMQSREDSQAASNVCDQTTNGEGAAATQRLARLSLLKQQKCAKPKLTTV